MAENSELILVAADILPVQGWHVFWAISKKQLDMVLYDIVEHSIEEEHDSQISVAEWQNTTLPVISLEKHFGLRKEIGSRSVKYMVVKGAEPSGERAKIVRMMIHSAGNISVRKLDFSCFSASAGMLPKRGEDVLGVYTLVGKNLLIVPDFAKIYASIKEKV